MKKLLTSICFVCLTFSLPAFAEKEEKVREIFKLNHIDKVMDTVLNQQIFIPIECTYIISEEEKSNIKKEIRDIMNIEIFLEPAIKLYLDKFTESELDDLIHFYRTKTGQKALEFEKEYAIAMPQYMQQWMEKIGPGIQEVAKNLNNKYPTRSGSEIQACMQKYQQ